MTANRLATASLAFLKPMDIQSLRPQALSVQHLDTRVSLQQGVVGAARGGDEDVFGRATPDPTGSAREEQLKNPINPDGASNRRIEVIALSKPRTATEPEVPKGSRNKKIDW